MIQHRFVPHRSSRSLLQEDTPRGLPRATGAAGGEPAAQELVGHRERLPRAWLGPSLKGSSTHTAHIEAKNRPREAIEIPKGVALYFVNVVNRWLFLWLSPLGRAPSHRHSAISAFTPPPTKGHHAQIQGLPITSVLRAPSLVSVYPRASKCCPCLPLRMEMSPAGEVYTYISTL